ncbi:copper amine oxidase N-terminal domain-containing protein [Chthonomonas calidirosea]|uniref:copper amine oxidase N-terminal domain-containing protein n=1 Tax=Chthonomonas calidirosea TaxID=454171 RepID=UPI0006EC798A|nr:copper amine oxidase N-terminal domain-containing protein [Chthonomonas calidirosea]CEK14037.1 copper amine oxidase family protein [Chthonomonas calidirosea]
MKNSFAANLFQKGLLCGVLAVGLAGLAPALADSGGRVVLPANSVIPVKLNTTLSSATAVKGDLFTATVATDNGVDYGLPPGTRIDGYVDDVRRHEGDQPGMLALSFRRIRLPDGRTYLIDGALIGLDNKSVEKTSDGRLIATPGHTDKRWTYVGYGAGAGLLVGLLTKHTFEDLLIGGGLGYLFGSLQKSHATARDVVLKSGTELGVRLDREVALNMDEQSGYRFHEEGDSRARPAVEREVTPITNTSHTYTSAANIGVLIGNRNVDFTSNATPVRDGKAILVPVRPVLEAAGIPFKFDGRVLHVDATGRTVSLTVGSRVAIVNDGERKLLEAPAQVLNGTLYVPMRFFESVTGQPVQYDSASQTVIIQTSSTSDMSDTGN